MDDCGSYMGTMFKPVPNSVPARFEVSSPDLSFGSRGKSTTSCNLLSRNRLDGTFEDWPDLMPYHPMSVHAGIGVAIHFPELLDKG
jgi:hypothetical protein